MIRVAVVGHVEWVRFARTARLPRPGEIMHARASWAEAAGGGAMAAYEMARLEAGAQFLTACGDDEPGRLALADLAARGLRVHAVTRAGTPHARVFTFLTDDGERTITVLAPPLEPCGADPLPWGELDGADGVYFCKGDAAALRAARKARVLVATARALPVLAAAHVAIDVLIGSKHDEGERYRPGDLDPPPRVVVATDGARGGEFTTAGGESGRWAPAPPPGQIHDAYGAGDSFAAALTVGLARGDELPDALALAARSGAAALCRSGAGR